MSRGGEVVERTMTTNEASVSAGPVRRSPFGLRILYALWGIAFLGVGGGACVLQWLGPPGGRVVAKAPPDSVASSAPVALAAAAPSPASQATASPPPAASPATPSPVAPVAVPAAPLAATPAEPPGPPASEHPETTPVPPRRAAEAVFTRHPAGAPISPPDPALLAQSTMFPDRQLPRVAADGRMPEQVYAGGFDMSDGRPKVALLLAGIGQSDVYSDDASRLLPPAVTFAVSPYANQPTRLLEQIRARGHEYLLSLPMEPQGAPVNDAGPQSLLTGATPGQNAQRLEWALTRITGYAGTTSALDGLRGERFSSSTSQLDPVLDLMAKSGLFYVDASPSSQRTPPFQTTRVPARAVDVVIDEPAVRSEIEKKLQALEQIARDRGSAIGLAGLPRPVTIDRIAAWANSLPGHGIALAPISVLVLQSPSGSAAVAPTAALTGDASATTPHTRTP